LAVDAEAHPLVSILIPTYNSEKFVARAIESAIGQSYSNIEIVVVDNASFDETLSVVDSYVKKYPNISVYRNGINIGPVNNWRRCVDKASGEYACLLFSDDWYEHDFIAEAAPHLSDAEIGFVYSYVRSITDDAGSYNTILYREFSEGKWPVSQLVESHLYFESGDVPLSPCCALFRLSDLKGALLNELPDKNGIGFMKHGAGPDLLVYLLIAKSYPSFMVIGEPMVNFLSHEENLSRERHVQLAYALAKAWFVSFYAEGFPALNLGKFKAAHFWRLYSCGGLKYASSSLSKDLPSNMPSWHLLVLYLVKRLCVRLRQKGQV